MESTTLSGTEHGLQHGVLEAIAWQAVQQACYALSGTHGPARKAAKQELTDALERYERLTGRRRNLINSQP